MVAQAIQFEQPPRLTGDPARDGRILVDYLWKYFNASITNGGLLQTAGLSTALEEQFPTLYALGVLPGTAANKIGYFTGESEWALTAFTDDARTLVSKDSVADMVTFLGVSTLTTEQVQDLVAALILNGSGITWTYDDGANTLTANLNQTTTSGVYTPTLTNVANLDGSTNFQCQYMRVGSVVTVSGKFSADPTAPGAVQLGISLPIASNIGAAEDVGGVAFASGIAGQGAAIIGDAANNRAEAQWVAVDLTNQPMHFNFGYRII